MKSRQRPTSTPHKPEGWQAPPPAWLASGRHMSAAESSLLGHAPPPHTTGSGTPLSRLSGPSPTSNSTSSSSYYMGMGSASPASVASPPLHPHGLSSPPAYGTRQASIEVHTPLSSAIKVTDYASEIHERHQRLASPVGYIGRPPQYQAFQAV